MSSFRIKYIFLIYLPGILQTSAQNRLVDADVNTEQIWGTSFETAASGVRFLYELNPRAIDVA